MSENNGQGAQIGCNVIKFEADTFNASMLTNLGPHPISQQPTVTTIAVGGLSKRCGVAMHILASLLSGAGATVIEDDEIDDEALDAMVLLSVKAAQKLIDGEKRIAKVSAEMGS